jgi:transposase-like protein
MWPFSGGRRSYSGFVDDVAVFKEAVVEAAMQPYSLDLRTRVGATCAEHGARKAAVARRFGVSCMFVQSLLAR